MRRHKTQDGHPPGQERWLVTYSDLITLLMIFFIVMYSMSQVDASKFRAMAQSLSITLGGAAPSAVNLSETQAGDSFIESGSTEDSTSTGQDDQQGIEQETTPSEGTGQGDTDYQENLTIEGIKAKLDQFAKENGIENKLVSSIEERGLVISIQDTLLFNSGSAEISTNSRAILKKISTVLSASPNFIKVEGHTCNLPIHTAEFRSNWELSVLRATNVVHILVDDGEIDPLRLSAAGYGEYRPVADNSTEQGRITNRRVDLIILRSKYDLLEPGSSSSNTATGADSNGNSSN
ncbi:MAG: OmpA family protein [Dehalobacter sp. 4CP]|uniref:flagellar motor protein MotB n=1 Tax=Dehalobacter sp. CP TaxID=2594474 RepID=UPI0013C9D292|nr:OmpA family protein [Dehalobacter sp. 4CP]